MRYIAPDYYFDFHCLAGNCRHSCCAGWEIDIDDASAACYRRLPGAFGRKLRRNMHRSGGTYSFRMTGSGRCPFLREDGLCELILQLGEDSLCDICADHPRFRNLIGDAEEVGLGLCCEAAAELILSRPEPVRFVVYDEDEEPAPSRPGDAELLARRQELLTLAQNRRLSVAERLTAAEEQFVPGRRLDLAAMARFMQGLERMEPEWPALLDLAQAPDCPELPAESETVFEQLFVYLLYRHLPEAAVDENLTGRLLFCTASLRLLQRIAARRKAFSLPALAELCRIWSAEIEYSDQNPALLTAALPGFYR